MAGENPVNVNPITGKTDPFGLSGNVLKIESNTDNKSSQIAEAQGESGEIVAHHVYGESMSPSAEYSVDAGGNLVITLGKVSTYNDKKVMLGNVTINTQIGSQPTVSASGEQVETGANTSHKFEAGTVNLTTSMHAQILFDAFTLPTASNANNGCALTAANYTASAEIVKSFAQGECVASDVIKGQIEAQITISSVKSGVVPTVTPGNGWTIVSPLTCTNPKSDYPTYTATLRKYLPHSVVTGS